MLLPPNLLLWKADVEDFNKCLQLGSTSAGDRIFSSSLTPHDIDNFLCHSCEPNCRFVIGRDLTAGLFATKPIAEVRRLSRACARRAARAAAQRLGHRMSRGGGALPLPALSLSSMRAA